ncbi:hypothetical protein Gasu2_52250 [Galdieria sulphuraria]|nr:hypothetical protein Gasu2_52250 [Galdieria sulphuraria]
MSLSTGSLPSLYSCTYLGISLVGTQLPRYEPFKTSSNGCTAWTSNSISNFQSGPTSCHFEGIVHSTTLSDNTA